MESYGFHIACHWIQSDTNIGILHYHLLADMCHHSHKDYSDMHHGLHSDFLYIQQGKHNENRHFHACKYRS